MTSRIVHFYFFRFRLIRREIRHFVFRSGSYETDKAYRSAISLRVSAKIRTKPTGWPPNAKRTNMTLTMAADSIRYFRDLFAIQTPTLLSWPICLPIDLMLIITPLETNARTLSRPNTDEPGRHSGNGLERNRRQLQLLREDSCVIKIRRYIRETNHYSIVDMEDIRYTKRQGRYSDKQTTKRSFPIPALM